MTRPIVNPAISGMRWRKSRPDLKESLSLPCDPPTSQRMTKDQLKQLEKDLWSAADKLRAYSDPKASEYCTPMLGITLGTTAPIPGVPAQ